MDDLFEELWTELFNANNGRGDFVTIDRDDLRKVVDLVLEEAALEVVKKGGWPGVAAAIRSLSSKGGG